MDYKQFSGFRKAVEIKSALQQIDDRNMGRARVSSQNGQLLSRVMDVDLRLNRYIDEDVFTNPGIMSVIPKSLVSGSLVQVGTGNGSKYGMINGKNNVRSIKSITVAEATSYIKANPNVKRYQLGAEALEAMMLIGQTHTLVEKVSDWWKKVINDYPLMLVVGVIIALIVIIVLNM